MSYPGQYGLPNDPRNVYHSEGLQVEARADGAILQSPSTEEERSVLSSLWEWAAIPYEAGAKTYGALNSGYETAVNASADAFYGAKTFLSQEYRDVKDKTGSVVTLLTWAAVGLGLFFVWRETR